MANSKGRPRKGQMSLSITHKLTNTESMDRKSFLRSALKVAEEELEKARLASSSIAVRNLLETIKNLHADLENLRIMETPINNNINIEDVIFDGAMKLFLTAAHNNSSIAASKALQQLFEIAKARKQEAITKELESQQVPTDLIQQLDQALRVLETDTPPGEKDTHD